MKLATIPPYCMAPAMLQTDYQLVLPECFRDEGYTRVVYEIKATNDGTTGNFIILDNGAAEGEAWHPQALLAVGREFGVHEIVVPDVMMDHNATMERLEEFIGCTTATDRHSFRWMGVPQGLSIWECIKSVEAYAACDFIRTIGIPRHLLQTLGDKYARAVLCNYINDNFRGRFQIHFLGSSAQWLAEPHHLAANCQARGLDTSLPFYAAHHGIEIDMLDPPIIARPEQYFERAAFEYPVHLVEHNMRILKGWLKSGT